MDLELLDMLEEHIQSFRDERKIKALKEACNNLVESNESVPYSFLIGSLYGSCLFIRESYSSKKRSVDDEKEFNQWFYNHIKGLELSIK
jgi:hypothetical protein